jgi:predicted nucleic acid-binding protein
MNHPCVVVFDACVLYPAPLRDLLMWLSKNGLISPRWSDEILMEWVENLLHNRPDLKRERLLRTCAEMNRAVPDSLTTDYEGLIEGVTLPDVDDRHVVAVALRSQAGVILTWNLKDFPSDKLPNGIIALSPDSFLTDLFRDSPEEVVETMREHRSMLTRPEKSAEEYLATFEANGLSSFVRLLREHDCAI